MFPTSFDEAEDVLGRPQGGGHEDVEPLAVCRTYQEDDAKTPVVISCWKCTAEELAEINRTGRVWVSVKGQTMPPIAVLGRSPFEYGQDSTIPMIQD